MKRPTFPDEAALIVSELTNERTERTHRPQHSRLQPGMPVAEPKLARRFLPEVNFQDFRTIFGAESPVALAILVK